jgi:hypothetical protein
VLELDPPSQGVCVAKFLQVEKKKKSTKIRPELLNFTCRLKVFAKDEKIVFGKQFWSWH